MPDAAIGPHGGCATLDRSLRRKVERAESLAHIAEALRAGWPILKSGGGATDDAEASHSMDPAS